MKSLAQEVARHRIRVNSIAPGAIRTPINAAAWKDHVVGTALFVDGGMTLYPGFAEGG